jgi:hypothetical protein
MTLAAGFLAEAARHCWRRTVNERSALCGKRGSVPKE